MQNPGTTKIPSVIPRRIGLKTKLILTMMGVGILPLLLIMVISYFQGNQSLQEVIGSNFKVLAFETSNKIDLLMSEEIAKNIRLATHPTIILTVEARNSLTARMKEAEIDSHFSKEAEMWERQDPQMNHVTKNRGSRVLENFVKGNTSSSKSTRALFFTDANGILVSSINVYPNFLNAQHPFWEKTLAGDKDFYIGRVYLDPKIGEYVFHIAIPIRFRGQEPIGVFHRVYAAKDFFSSSLESIVFGKTGHVMLINSEGIVIDCPILPTGFQLTNPELVQAVTKPEANWVKTNGNGHEETDELSIIGFSPLLQTNEATRASTGQEWFIFTWQASEEIFAPTRKLLLWILVVSVFSVLLITFMGFLASNKVIQPIRQLQATAAQIGRGQKVDPLDIRTGDEIEILANEINSMNDKLNLSFAGLEDEVREKSKEVLYLHEYTDSILISVPDVLIIFDEDLKTEFANPAFEELAGVTHQEILGKSLNETDVKFKSEWESLAEELQEFSMGVVSKTSRKLDGRIIHCYEAMDPLDPTTAPHLLELQNTFTLNGKSFYYQFFFVAVKTRDKRRIGLVMRETTEEKKLQDQLTRAERLSGLGTLSAGIAHEMNNPLNSIMGFSEQILSEKPSSKVTTLSGKILNRAKQMASIIRNMSDYARSGITDEFKEVNINNILDSAIEIAFMAHEANEIVLQKNYSSLPLLKSKPEEIQQIFVNIISNGVQAMEGKGQLILSSHEVDNNIVVKIQDNGPGIPPKYVQRIFDPFFTTKEQGKGTGLGLNIVHRLVEKYGGYINVESKQGEGTTFIVTFPVNQ